MSIIPPKWEDDGFLTNMLKSMVHGDDSSADSYTFESYSESEDAASLCPLEDVLDQGSSEFRDLG